MKAHRALAISAAASCGICLLLSGGGAGATFTRTGSVAQQVRTGTVSLTATACTSASDNPDYLRTDDSDHAFDICDGGTWQPCQPRYPMSASTLATVGSTPTATTTGFTSSTAVAISGLSGEARDLPISIPALTTNQGTLPIMRIGLSLAISPSNGSAENLVATVLFDGTVVSANRTLSSLTNQITPLLTNAATLPPQHHGLIQIDLSNNTHTNGRSFSQPQPFTITVTLTGSDF